MTGKRGTLQERFERHYIPVTECGCWIWTGSTHKKQGYGYINSVGNKPLRAHVLSYRLFKGPVPKGLDVRHTCDMRCCVNPDHLLIGTRKQNMEDAERRGKIARGFKLPQTKLSDAQVAAIIIDTRPHKEIANEYDITPSYVSVLQSCNGNRRHKNTFIETPWGKLEINAAAAKAGLKPVTLRYRINNGVPEKRWFEIPGTFYARGRSWR